jgi:carboxylesterase type B
VFGQSAGAADTFVLATLPEAPELMSAAAMESGGGRMPPTVAEVQDWQTLFVDALNCSVTDVGQQSLQ